MGKQHTDHNPSTPTSRTEAEWESWDTETRIAHLRVLDQDAVAILFRDARSRARARVQAEWLENHGTLAAQPVFAAWRAASDSAALEAEVDLWVALGAGEVEDRCHHGASLNKCSIARCPSMRTEAPPKQIARGYIEIRDGDWRLK